MPIGVVLWARDLPTVSCEEADEDLLRSAVLAFEN
jgi:hypothetical protein